MKTLIAFLLTTTSLFGQMYDWTTNVNPGWTASTSGNNSLSWQSSITTVSTSGFNSGTSSWYTYNNSQVNTYTSPIYDFTSCVSPSIVQVTLQMDINLENRYDWLYFQYSTNGGTTWINPQPNSAATNASGVNLSAYAPQTTWVNNNSNRNGWTGSVGAIAVTYTVPNTTNRFRFIFEADGTVNSYTIGFTTYVYYADLLDFTVNCVTPLPVELISFEGEVKDGTNVLVWNVGQEVDCDYYTVERSEDGYEWIVIGDVVLAAGKKEYNLNDNTFQNKINYYRLSQTDKNGTKTTYNKDIVILDNRSDTKIIGVYDLLGQAVTEDYSGIVLFVYSDGKIEKRFQK